MGIFSIFRSKKGAKEHKRNKYPKSGEIRLPVVPRHIGIILDGNGRWARKRGLPRTMGHREGAKNLKPITRICAELGIEYLTVYAFSTENWNRPKDEVDGIMKLLLEFLKNADEEIGKDRVRIRVIGDTTPLSDEIKQEIKRVEQNTKDNDAIDLLIALNYGGRREIVDAAKKMTRDVLEGRLQLPNANEDVFSSYMYTSGIPDPDLIIRPSGEQRLSNFLIWQSAYSEFWYSNVLWPDFRKNDLIEALETYAARDRRFGGVKQKK